MIGEFSALITPAPKRNSSEWAEQKLYCPATSPFPGHWNPLITPWTKKIAEIIEKGGYDRYYSIQPAQTGKTAFALNLAMQILQDKGMPVMILEPTQNMSGDVSKRFDAQARMCPDFWAGIEKTATGKVNTYKKLYNGVGMYFPWAGSATEVAARSVFCVAGDELDRQEEIKGEGHPFIIADARLTAFISAGAFSVGISTPTYGFVETEKHPDTGLIHWAYTSPKDGDGNKVIESFIWQRWQDATACEFAVPCPECEEYFIPRRDCLFTPEGATPQEARNQSGLICPTNGCLIDMDANPHKRLKTLGEKKAWMNERGFYLSQGQFVKNGKVHGDLPENTEWSGWVSGALSPLRTLGALAEATIKAELSRSPAMIKPMINTKWGELYYESGQSIDWREITKLRSPDYSMGEVPSGVQILILTIDPGEQNLWYWVEGFGMDMERWLIDVGEKKGYTHKQAVWDLMGKFRTKSYGGLLINKCGIDFKYVEARTKAGLFADKYGEWVYLMNGKATMDKLYHLKTVGQSPSGKHLRKTGQRQVTWSNDDAKTETFMRFRWDKDEQGAGGMHFPSDCPDWVFKQLSNEQKIEGTTTWIEKGPNHCLDMAGMAWVMAYVLKQNKRRKKQKAPDAFPDMQIERKKTDDGIQLPDYPAVLRMS